MSLIVDINFLFGQQLNLTNIIYFFSNLNTKGSFYFLIKLYFLLQAYRAEHWEEWSLIRNDEAPEIFGHMQGLSIVEANIMIKGSNLDGQIGFIDFSLVNAVTEGAHVDDNQLMVENKRLLGTRGTLETNKKHFS